MMTFFPIFGGAKGGMSSEKMKRRMRDELLDLALRGNRKKFIKKHKGANRDEFALFL